MAELDIRTKMVTKQVEDEEKTYVLTLTEDEIGALTALVGATPCGQNDLYYDIFRTLSDWGVRSKADVPDGTYISVTFENKAW